MSLDDSEATQPVRTVSNRGVAAAVEAISQVPASQEKPIEVFNELNQRLLTAPTAEHRGIFSQMVKTLQDHPDRSLLSLASQRLTDYASIGGEALEKNEKPDPAVQSQMLDWQANLAIQNPDLTNEIIRNLDQAASKGGPNETTLRQTIDQITLNSGRGQAKVQ
jgi:chorismate mutase